MAAASSTSGGGGPRDDRGKGVLVQEVAESSTAAERRAAERRAAVIAERRAARRAAERRAAVLGESERRHAERRAAVLGESSAAAERRAAERRAADDRAAMRAQRRAAVLGESSTAAGRRAAVLPVPALPYRSRTVFHFRNLDGFNFSAYGRLPPEPRPDWPVHIYGCRRVQPLRNLDRFDFAAYRRFRDEHIVPVHGEPPPPPPPPPLQAQFYAYARRKRFVYLLLFFVYINIGIGFFLISQLYSYKTTKGPYFSGTNGTSYTDATYFTVVSLSSIGFGDIYPLRKAAEIFVCCYIYAGLLLFAIVSVILSRGMNELERLLIHWYVRVWGMRNPNLGGRYCGARICINLVLSLALTWILSLKSNLYIAVTSVTTVGFGNQSFLKTPDRVFAFFLLFPAVMVYGRLASLVGDYFGTPLEN